MSIDTKQLWAVRTENETDFLNTGSISLTGMEAKDWSAFPAEKDAFKTCVRVTGTDRSPVMTGTGANLAFRLVHELQNGDYIAFFHGDQIHLGRVAGPYCFTPAVSGAEHRRPVEWLKTFPMNTFSRAALREITASPMPLFAVKRYTGEFFNALGVPYLEETPRKHDVSSVQAQEPLPVWKAFEPHTDVRETHADAQERHPATRKATIVRETNRVTAREESGISPETIEELNRAFLNAQDLPDFLAELLRAMGYQVCLTKPAGRVS